MTFSHREYSTGHFYQFFSPLGHVTHNKNIFKAALTSVSNRNTCVQKLSVHQFQVINIIFILYILTINAVLSSPLLSVCVCVCVSIRLCVSTHVHTHTYIHFRKYYLWFLHWTWIKPSNRSCRSEVFLWVKTRSYRLGDFGSVLYSKGLSAVWITTSWTCCYLLVPYYLCGWCPLVWGEMRWWKAIVCVEVGCEDWISRTLTIQILLFLEIGHHACWHVCLWNNSDNVITIVLFAFLLVFNTHTHTHSWY